eukprot:TRINITY_DN3910_c0_g1_i2.p2 TRINITY_DN3910_c0_g1~~TRINITY_DN3910_c0_g1_i2.p2  ORF type:complete len:437 (-),score=77.46 TRINITY_DN3910_c0_g1_i2:357-1667(-)
MNVKKAIIVLVGLCLVAWPSCRAEEIEGFSDEEEFTVGSYDKIEREKPKQSGVKKPTEEVFWDEDEFEGFPQQSSKMSSNKVEKEKPAKRERAPKQPLFSPIQQEHWYFEILAVIGLILYMLNIWRGTRENESIALAWATCFCAEDGLMARNFSLLGPGDSATNGEILMRESKNIYKFYASGRRYCKGLLATLDLQPRQDIVSLLLALVWPKDDRVEIEVNMNESCMPPMVIAVGTSKAIKQLMTDKEDVANFTRKFNPPKDQLAGWPGDRLVVLTDSTQVFCDIMNDHIMNQVFGSRAFEEVGKYFRYLYFSTESTEGKPKRMLNFSFRLPPKNKMENISRLMNCIMIFIDSVGSYNMPPELRKKAEKRRAEIDKKLNKEGRMEREQAIADKKEEQRRQEIEKARRMGPEALEKFEEKQRKTEMKKAIKKMTKKG